MTPMFDSFSFHASRLWGNSGLGNILETNKLERTPLHLINIQLRMSKRVNQGKMYDGKADPTFHYRDRTKPASKHPQNKWSQKQNLKYVDYLQKSAKAEIDSPSRKKKFFFSKMAEAVQTKNNIQCRSHHQKLVKRFSTLENIISFFQRKVQQNEVPEQRDEGSRLDENLDNSIPEENTSKSEMTQKSSADSKLQVQTQVPQWQKFLEEILSERPKIPFLNV